MVVSQTATILPNSNGLQSAFCPVGSQPISGSCTTDVAGTVRNLTLQQAGFFEIAPREWVCLFRNNEPVPVAIRASVTCLNPTP